VNVEQCGMRVVRGSDEKRNAGIGLFTDLSIWGVAAPGQLQKS
jgi:hypothetical protein